MRDQRAAFRCERSLISDSVQVFGFTRHGPDTQTWKTVPGDLIAQGGSCVGEPMLSLSYAQAQEFIDELWRCGLRPTEGSGSAGSLAATERHLKDMQGIALALLRKDGAQV